MPSNMGSQLVANFANLNHEGLLGYLLIPIKPSPSILFKFLSCTEIFSMNKLKIHIEKDRTKVKIETYFPEQSILWFYRIDDGLCAPR